MSVPTTISKWIDVPTAVLNADRPLSAGVLQVLASNASWACRTNNIRPLWRGAGSTNQGVLGTLGWDGLPSSFPWDSLPDPAYPVFKAFLGVFRLRPYGETGVFPKITLRTYLTASASATAGVILVVRPVIGLPGAGDLTGVVTHSTTVQTEVTVSVQPTSADVGRRAIQPVIGRAYPITEPPESGEDTVVAIYIGAYTSSGGKGTLGPSMVYLEAP